MAGCPAKRQAAPDCKAAPAPKLPRLENEWDPKTGKGAVLSYLKNGDVLRTCFQCGFPGYTGGLVIGSYNGSGMGLYPKTPIRGFKSINVFCAQDESLRDHGDGLEYSYGWSENYGTGRDGQRLEYVRGQVLEASAERVVLRSQNRGGCYRVEKVATTRAGAHFWIIATRVTNTCKEPTRLDLFSGDDPWIGLYKSSDGDVGWTPDGLVRHEKRLPRGRFTAGGLYDLGNRALGQKEGSFSGQANFFLLDPATPLPHRAYFANRFAHADSEVDEKKELTHKSLTALNLGWTGLELKPGQGFTFALALGLAEVGKPGEVPKLPEISPADWSLWRAHLQEGNPKPGAAGLEFAAERVELDLAKDRLTVTGTYHLRNRSNAAGAASISFPIITAADRPAPAGVTVNGLRVPLVKASDNTVEARFPVSFPPRGLVRFTVRYSQDHSGRRAAYMVTSARRWPAPIDRAVFIVRHPAAMGAVKVAHPPDLTRQVGNTVEQTIVRHRFWPDKEMELTW